MVAFPVPPFSELTITLFGKPGSGKTRFAAGDPDTMFICTEPGAEMLRARKWPVREVGKQWRPPTWLELVDVIDKIEKKKQDGTIQINSVAIDIVDNLYQACQDYICVDNRVRLNLPVLEHPSDLDDFGKTWGLVSKEWKKQIGRLMGCVNVRFLSHSEEAKVEVINQNKLKEEVTRIGATFSGGKGGKCGQYLDGIVNAMGFMTQDGSGRHTITFKQEATVGAKDRTDILAKLGPIELPDDPNAGFSHVCAAYATQAEAMGFKVQSLWR